MERITSENQHLDPAQAGPRTATKRFTPASPTDRPSHDRPDNFSRTQAGTAALIHFDRARMELERAASIDEVKSLRDKAEAMRLYARQSRHCLEMHNLCAEIKIRAERRLGEMLQEAAISERGHNNLLRGRTVRPRDVTPTLSDLGVSKSQSGRFQMLSSIGEEEFEARVEEVKKSGKELTSKDMVSFAKYLRRDRTRRHHREKALGDGEKVCLDHRTKILTGDFRERLVEPIIEEDSVDLILTDPPYGREYLTLWGDLAEFATTALKPGKLLVAYSGNCLLN